MKTIPEDVKYIVWHNSGEGWSMTMFQEWEEVQSWVFRGENYGAEYTITKPVRAELKELDK